jgi:hypothetical protein
MLKKRTCFDIVYHYNKAVNAAIRSLSLFSLVLFSGSSARTHAAVVISISLMGGGENNFSDHNFLCI